MDIETIDNIVADWRNGFTHGELLNKYNASREQEYAITMSANKMTSEVMRR